MRELTIDSSHQGPFGTANGGYVAGILGDALGGAASSVRIHKPVPVDTPIQLVRHTDSAVLLHDEQVVASAESIDEAIPTTGFVTKDEILDAGEPTFDMGMFAGCFVCGQDAPLGLGVKPKPLADGRFGAIWRPLESRHLDLPVVDPVYLRSALDCPGGFAALHAHQTLAVTGTLTSRIEFVPDADSTLIVLGEATWSEGRKLGAVSTIFTETGETVATASAIWIALSPMAGSLAATVDGGSAGQ